MSDPTPAGFYHAAGDPPDTVRYWDGARWSGEPTVHATTDAPNTGAGSFGSVGRRMGASAIDLALSALPIAILAIIVVIQAIDPNDRNQEFNTFATGSTENMIAIAIVFGELAIGVLMVAFLGGTPGKLIVGLRIVKHDGQKCPPGIGSALRRVLPGLVSAFIGMLPLTMPILAIVNIILVSTDDEHQSIYDRVGGTRVVLKSTISEPDPRLANMSSNQ